MKYNSKIIFGTIARWVIALLFIGLTIGIIDLFVRYPLNWLLWKTSTWGIIAHIASWVILTPIVLSLTIGFIPFIGKVGFKISRNSPVFIVLLFLSYVAYVIFLLFVVWKGLLIFNWEENYGLANRILFSMILCVMSFIPFGVAAKLD